MSKTYDTTEKTATGSNGGDEPDEAVVGYTQAQISSDSTDDELLAYIIDPVEKKALLRRLDSFIAPMVAILYLISFRESSSSSSSRTSSFLLPSSSSPPLAPSLLIQARLRMTSTARTSRILPLAACSKILTRRRTA